MKRGLRGLLVLIGVILLLGFVVAFSSNLNYPTNNTWYDYNLNHFNWTIDSPEFPIDACWYVLNGDVNIIADCSLNTTSLTPQENSNTLIFYANNTQGWQLTEQITFYIDTTFPTIDSIGYPLNQTYDSSVTQLNYVFTEINPDSCWYSTDNGASNSAPETCDNLFSSMAFSEGTNTWTVFINDSAGNEASLSRTFWVDSLFPSITINIPSLSLAYLSQNYIPVNVSVDETNEKSIIFDFYDSTGFNILREADNSAPFLVGSRCPSDGSIEDGTYTYNVTVQDTLGHITVTGGTVILDTINPSLSTSFPENTTYDSALAQLNFTINDTNLDNTCIFSNNSGVTNLSFVCASGENTYPFNSIEEDNTWTITVFDKAGNSNTSTINFWVDSIYPVIEFTTLTLENNSMIGENSIFANVSVTEAHEQNITFSLYDSSGIVNSTTFTDSTRTINWTNLPQEDYTYVVTVIDVVGHSTSTQRRAVLDITSPSYSNPITFPSFPVYSSSQNYLFNMTWTDNFAGINTVYINFSNTIYPMSNSGNDYYILFSDLPAGNYSYSFFANDTVGNENETNTQYYYIEQANPQAQFTIENWTIEYGESINISYSESNQGDDDVSYKIYKEGVDIGAGEGIITPSVGSYVYILNSTQAQNYTSNQSITTRTLIVNDTTSPVISLITFNNKAFNFSSTALIEFNITELSALNCSLYLNNLLNQTIPTINQSLTQNFSLSNLASGKYNYSISCSDIYNNIQASSTKYFTLLGNTSFSNSTSYPDLTTVEDITNVSDFYVININYGGINFTDSIDFSSGEDWSQYLSISSNRIEINSSAFPQLNKSAKLTIYSLTWDSPQILKDGSVCSDCSLIGYTNGTLSFSVTGFSVYTTQETPVSPGGSSGGSSGGTSTTSCTTEWTCTEWSDCINEISTRTCTKLNPLCSALTKPEETMNCLSEIQEETENNEPEEISQEESSFFKTITGAIIGSRGVQIAGISLGAIALIIGIYFSLMFVRKKKRKR